MSGNHNLYKHHMCTCQSIWWQKLAYKSHLYPKFSKERPMYIPSHSQKVWVPALSSCSCSAKSDFHCRQLIATQEPSFWVKHKHLPQHNERYSPAKPWRSNTKNSLTPFVFSLSHQEHFSPKPKKTRTKYTCPVTCKNSNVPTTKRNKIFLVHMYENFLPIKHSLLWSET